MCNCDAFLKYHKIFVIDYHISCSVFSEIIAFILSAVVNRMGCTVGVCEEPAQVDPA